MKVLVLVPFLLLVGCERPKTVDMGARFFTRPIELVVEVKSAKARHDSVYGRFETEMLVLEPSEKRGSALSVVVDGAGSGEDSIVTPNTRWRITADELIFEEQKKVGITFLNVADMKPRNIEEPNQSVQRTGADARR